MPNQITASGLETKTVQDLSTEFTTDLEAIYGPDIDLSQNSPDGQLMMIFVQSVIDNLDLLTQIYNSFDPDKAFGRSLDARVAINGIQRQAGTSTATSITVVTSQAVTLDGLDTAPNAPYTVADANGNQYQLTTTTVIPSAGSNVLPFQAAKTGASPTIPNTITIPVTVVLGVSSINNPSAYTTLGTNEETDAALRIRRQQSVSLASQGYLAGLLAALENVSNLLSAYVYENNTNVTDIDGVPGHSIWVITSGGADADIANAIYKKRNAGCGMFALIDGSEKSYIITQVDGTPFTVEWNQVVNQTLYIEFDVSSIDGINVPNAALIQSTLPTLLVPGVYERLNINDLATLVQQIDNNALVTGAGFGLSGGGPFTPTLIPTAKNKQFSLLSANINITVI